MSIARKPAGSPRLSAQEMGERYLQGRSGGRAPKTSWSYGEDGAADGAVAGSPPSSAPSSVAPAADPSAVAGNAPRRGKKAAASSPSSGPRQLASGSGSAERAGAQTAGQDKKASHGKHSGKDTGKPAGKPSGKDAGRRDNGAKGKGKAGPRLFDLGDVSRETELRAAFIARIRPTEQQLAQLDHYAAQLKKWQLKINLVGPSTLPELWDRHFLDSAQLVPHLPAGLILDLGSGAGFPGLVIAILRGGPVHLVEVDVRKATFLREMIRQLGLEAKVSSVRIETLKPFPVAAITARALASLDQLLDWAEPFLPGAQCLFLKGRSCEEELTTAAKTWKMQVKRISSWTESDASLLHLEEVARG